MKTQFVAELFREYQERKSRSRGYSERAFARDIGLSPGFFKLLMQRKKKISADRARKVARILMWSEEKIAFLTADASIHDLDFLEITDWYHFAVIEMLRTSKMGLSADEMARRLGITRSEVDYAMKHLQSTRGDSAEGEAKLQRQTLSKAIEALDNSASAIFSAECLAFDPARADEVRAFFAQVVADFRSQFSDGDRTAIYQLNLAFHRLDKSRR